MEIINSSPWKWQNDRSYSQAVEVKNVQSTLYVSGQAAIDANGVSSAEDMESQIKQALQNVEHVVTEAGFECSGIVRINIFTTSTAELWPHFNIFQDWIAKHNIKQATSMIEVVSLFETLMIEFEATVVK